MKICITQHCPKILNKLEKAKQLSWSCKTTWSGGDEYLVVGLDRQFIIDGKERSCTCRRWHLIGSDVVMQYQPIVTIKIGLRIT